MRVNVYSEEITPEVKVVCKPGTTPGRIFWGIRFYLSSAPSLHHSPADDDRSAVTFWAERDGRPLDRLGLSNLFILASEKLRQSLSLAPESAKRVDNLPGMD